MTHSPVALRSRFRARTERLPDETDLLDHLGEGGAAWLDSPAGFVTAGVAASVAPTHAVATLRTVEPDPDAPAGVSARAVGALPFAGGGRLIVPASIVQRDEAGGVWRTVLEPAAVPADACRPIARRGPTSYRISQVSSTRAWEANVAAVLALVDAGALEKVVLAREIVVEADRPFDLRAALAVLRATQPGCVVYADHSFVGASPELLVRRTGADVTARPMAGTGAQAGELARSEKDGREHRFEGYTVAAANTGYYGGGMNMAPGADPSDGLLDVIFIENVSKARFIANLPKVFKGTHVELDSVEVHRAREVEISSDRPFDVYADGDPLTTLPATVRLVRGGLSILAPRA